MLTRRALLVLEQILAIEVLVAISALDDRPRLPVIGNGTRPVHDMVRATLEPLDANAPAVTVVETVRRGCSTSSRTYAAALSTARNSSASVVARTAVSQVVRLRELGAPARRRLLLAMSGRLLF